MNAVMKQIKAGGLGSLTRAVLWKVKYRIPRYNPHYFLNRIDGIIHVGANSGQERGLYALHNLAVLWVEALPNLFHQLCENIKMYPMQSAANYLITDRDDANYIFHIANNEGESSSILEPKDHRNIWPDVKFERDMMLKSITLDSLLKKIGKPTTAYQALAIDTQGSELLVLKGAKELLRLLKFVKVEAADFEAYSGCAKVGDLIAYLKEHDFRLIRQDPFPMPNRGCGSYYELLFRKVGR